MCDCDGQVTCTLLNQLAATSGSERFVLCWPNLLLVFYPAVKWPYERLRTNCTIRWMRNSDFLNSDFTFD